MYGVRYKSDPSDVYAKPKYFGGKEPPSDAQLPQKKREQAEDRRKEASRAQAEQRWHAYEASLLGQIVQPAIAPTVANMFDVFDILQRQRAAELAMTGATTTQDVAEIRQKLQTGLTLPGIPAYPTTTPDAKGKTVQDVIDAYASRCASPIMTGGHFPMLGATFAPLCRQGMGAGFAPGFCCLFTSAFGCFESSATTGGLDHVSHFCQPPLASHAV